MAGTLISPVHGEITFSYDSSGVLRARNELGHFVSDADVADARMRNMDRSSQRSSRSFMTFGSVLGGVGRALGAVAPKLIGISVAASSVVPIITVLGQAIASLGPVAGAALAVLPGAMLIAAAAAITLKAAFAGVGEAVSSAFDADPAKFNEAIKGLAPNAQAAASAFRSDVVPAIKSVQQNIQQVAFTGLADKVSALKGTFAGLRHESGGVGTAINLVLGKVLDFGATSAAVTPMKNALLTVKNLFHQIGTGITPLLEGVFSLAGQFTALGAASSMQGIGDMLAGWGESLKQVDIKAVFASAMEAMQPFLNLFKDIGTIVKAVFTALQGDSENALGVLGELVNKVAEFVSSAEGKAALDALGSAMRVIAGEAGQALLGLLQALSPVIVTLSPLFAQIAELLGGALGAAFTALAPVLAQVATALTDSLAPALPTIMEAFEKIAPVIGEVAGAFGGVLAAAIPIVVTAFAALADPLAKVVDVLGAVLTPIITAFAIGLEVLEPILTPLLIAFLLWKTITTAMAAAQILLNLAMTANPIGLIIAGIILLVGLFVMAYQKSETFRDILSALGETFKTIWEAIKTAVSAAIKFVVDLIGFMIAWVKNKFGEFKANIDTVWNAIKAGISAAWEGAVNFVKGGVDRVKGFIQTLSEIPGKVAGFFGRMKDAIVDKIGQAVDFVRGIPGKIMDALGDLGGKLAGAGRDLIQGLVNGISNMAGKVADKVREIINKIPQVVKDLLGIGSPSKIMIQFGEWTGEGLAIGLARSSGMIAKAAQDAAGSIAMPISLAAAATPGMVASAVGGGRPGSSTSTSNTYAPVMNVNGLPGQSPNEIGKGAMRQLLFSLKTGA